MSGYQSSMHMPYCQNSGCTGCLPTFPVRPNQDRGLPTVFPRPGVHLPTQLAPTAKPLLLAFHRWLEKQPHETLEDPEWTPERLVDMFIMEATGAEADRG